jgi:hypothetical protein
MNILKILILLLTFNVMANENPIDELVNVKIYNSKNLFDGKKLKWVDVYLGDEFLQSIDDYINEDLTCSDENKEGVIDLYLVRDVEFEFFMLIELEDGTNAYTFISKILNNEDTCVMIDVSSVKYKVVSL